MCDGKVVCCPSLVFPRYLKIQVNYMKRLHCSNSSEFVLYCRERFVFDCSTAEKKPADGKDDNSR